MSSQNYHSPPQATDFRLHGTAPPPPPPPSLPPPVNLDLLVGPLTDLNYKHVSDFLLAPPANNNNPADASSSSCLSRSERVAASSHAVTTLLRCWPGVAHFCGGSGGSGSGVDGEETADGAALAIKSLLGVLHVPDGEMIKDVIDLLFAIFDIPAPPEKEEDLLKAIAYVADPSKFPIRHSWRLSAG